MENNNKKFICWDLETIKGCFLASFYFPEEDKWVDFLINKYQNDLYKMLKFLEDHKNYTFIGFNSISFDAQIVEWMVDKAGQWFDKTNMELAAMISAFGSKVIDDSHYGLFLPYREENFTYKQLDVPRVLHWFNEKKRVGLKQAEFELRAETIENFDVEVNKEDFTEEEVADLVHYCHNDVIYTYEIFKYIKGEVDHPLYKGKNKLVDRDVMEKEFGIPCLNWDDVKIGAEWNKKDYMEMTSKKEYDLKPAKVNHFYGKKYKRFIPKTVEFQSPGLKKFIHEFGESFVTAEKQIFAYVFREDLVVAIGKGGIHSQELPRMLRPADDEVFIQNDIGSQYPNALRKYEIYPSHLGIEWNQMLVGKISRRLNYKSLYKQTKDSKYNSLQEMGKLSLNGGAYGRLGLSGDWQEDPCAMLQVTIGCQLEILMIVEALVLKGFNVTSVNTDGWDAIVPKARLDEYFDITDYYEEKIGNKELGQLEYTVYKWMAQTSVNDYAAEKLGVYEKRQFKEDTIAEKNSKYPHLKLKGDFTIDFLLEKNSSFRVKPLALVEWLDKGTDPADFINKHADIFDFCARSSSGQTYIHKKKGTEEVLPKILRYYVAKDGIDIMKMVKPTVTTKARNTNVQPADYKKMVCNRLPKEDHEKHLENVDRRYYIESVLETIAKINSGKKTVKTKKVDQNQMSMF